MRTVYRKYICHRLLAGLAVSCCGLAAKSQELNLAYFSEWQTDFKRRANWINMLQMEGSLNISPGWSASLGTISVCKTYGGNMISDMLAYSNIEEENIAVAIDRLGVGLDKGKWSVFAGVGNVNGAFFMTPLTSLFTNSSCGIFPTISCNFSIANFPDASMGIEVQYKNNSVTANSAVYNGKGYHGFVGKDCVFRISPSSDGIFNINAVNYSKYGNNYNMGMGVHHGYSNGDEVGTQNPMQTEITENKTTEIFYWIYAEQKIIPDVCVIAQFSQCPGIQAGCRNFYGGGVAYTAKKFDVALYSCYADFIDNYEWANELTFRYVLSSRIYLQSSLHYIKNLAAEAVVGLFRMCVTI